MRIKTTGMLSTASLTAAFGLALSLPVAAQTPEQRQAPAGIAAEYFAERPACRQLKGTPSPAAPLEWTSWGIDVGGQHVGFYGLESGLSEADAFYWLGEAGICVRGGVEVPLIGEEEPEAAADAPDVASVDPSDPEAVNPHRAGSYEYQLWENRRTSALRRSDELEENASGDGGDSGITSFMAVAALFVGGWFLKQQMPLLKEVDAGAIWDGLGPQAEDTYNAPDPTVQPVDVSAAPTVEGDVRVVSEGLMSDTVFQLILDSPSISRALFGSQRTGKSNLAAQATKRLQQQGFKIFHLNLAGFTDPMTGINEDAAYWEHAESVQGDITAMQPDEASHLIDQAIKLVQAFVAHRGAAILVVDEWMATTPKGGLHADGLKTLAGMLAQQVSALSSTGYKRRKSLLALAPKIVAGEISQDGLSIKSLSPVLVAIAPGHTAEWGGQKITFNREIFGQVNTNYGNQVPEPPIGFESDRIGYINGQWLPLGAPPTDHAALTKANNPSPGAAGLIGQESAQENLSFPSASPGANVAVMPAPTAPRPEPPASQDSPEVAAFMRWLSGRQMQNFNYRTFANANAFKEFERSREKFEELCQVALFRNLIIKQEQPDVYWVLPATR